MIAIIFKLAWRNVLGYSDKNKIIVSIIIVSVIFIQFLWALSEGFGRQVKTFALDSLVGNMQILHENAKIDPSVANSFEISDITLNKIASIKGVVGVTKRVKVPMVLRSERVAQNAILVGIDLVTEQKLSFYGKDYLPYNEPITYKNNGVVMGKTLVDDLETQKNFRVVASAEDYKGNSIESPLYINDIYKSSMPNVEEMYFFQDIKQVQNRYNLGNKVTEVSIIFSDDKYTDALYDEINKLIPPHTKLYKWGDIMGFLKNWLAMMTINITVFFLIVFISASFPLANTLLISVLERTHEFGIINALGLKKFYIFLLIMFEAFFILLISISIGFILGAIITITLSDIGINISGFGAGLAQLGLGDYLYPHYNIVSSIIIASLLFVIGMLVSLYPAIKASLYNPTTAMSKRG